MCGTINKYVRNSRKVCVEHSRRMCGMFKKFCQSIREKKMWNTQPVHAICSGSMFGTLKK